MTSKRVLILIVYTLVLSTFLACFSAYAEESVPVITKNPTSEAIAIGGKTWFIAHADNANTMTWELVDPNGNIYSLADAMAMHPGLKLEALEGDTIAVSNVPVSVNGWGVQATFYGQGGAVSTSPAYIYVGDFLTAYGSVINKYRTALSNILNGNGSAFDYGVSEWVNSAEHVGYALKDIDKNGIPELIIGGINTQEYYVGSVIFEIFTLSNNLPVSVATSHERHCFSLLTDNRLYYEAFGGAGHTYYETYQLVNDHIEFLEGFYSTSFDNNGNVAYRLDHTLLWNGATSDYPQPSGNYDNPDYSIVIDNYDDLNVYYSSIDKLIKDIRNKYL